MRPITLSPAGKQPIKIASHIELCKRSSAKEIMFFNIVIKRLRKLFTLQNIALTIGAISALTAWFSSIIYDSTDSSVALTVLVISSIVGLFSAFPVAIYGKANGKKRNG